MDDRAQKTRNAAYYMNNSKRDMAQLNSFTALYININRLILYTKIKSFAKMRTYF